MVFELETLLVIITDCTGSSKSNYYAITTTTPRHIIVQRKKLEYKRRYLKRCGTRIPLETGGGGGELANGYDN
jgi:hypothetical protein